MMNIYTRGIRGAISVDSNTKEALELSTIELLSKMLEENKVDKSDISHVLFSLTADLNVDFPAKFARLKLGFDEVPMICYQELDVPGSMRKCLRVLMVVNTTKSQAEIKHIYLKEAVKLRPDVIQ